MAKYQDVLASIAKTPRTWLITGVAGFIGSNLLETLLKAGQRVRGLDNFATGYQKNLDMVKQAVGEERWKNFTFFEGDIRNLADCASACAGADIVLHEAALGSVPKSIANPIATNENNINGFLNMLVAARDAGIKRFVYAASSSTYGDEQTLPKKEERIGSPLSPYAVTKYVNELYAKVFASTYGTRCIGLRYFNIFGQRQDPDGAYAAVIPKWFSGIVEKEQIFVNGDGETSRDFCYIDNCVQANILAGMAEDDAWNRVYNVAFGERTTLNELFELIKTEVIKYHSDAAAAKPTHRDFRAGDVRHSLADISLAEKYLGYKPQFSVREGLVIAGEWYAKHL